MGTILTRTTTYMFYFWLHATAHHILSIPFSIYKLDDSLIWHGTSQGVYSTKNAYKPLSESDCQAQASSLSPSAHSGFWKSI